MKKRILSIVILALTLILAGCSNSRVENDSTDKTQISGSLSDFSLDILVSSVSEEEETETSISESPVSIEEKEPEPESISCKGFVIAPDRMTVVGGYCEQDGNEDNGPEAIEWLVLSDNEDSLVLISKYVLDMVPYNSSYAGTDWNQSYVRKYLNDEFFNTVFSEENQLAITDYATTKGVFKIIENAEATEESTEGEVSSDPIYSDTEYEIEPVYDKVFLLSFEEALLFFENTEKDSESRMALVSTYATQRGVWTIDKDGYSLFGFKKDGISENVIGCGNWWLRDNGAKNTQAMDVGASGIIRTTGHDVGSKKDGIRPCIVIKITE